MEATLQTVSSTVTVIRDPAEIQAAFEGEADVRCETNISHTRE
jgi:hypothetical protein